METNLSFNHLTQSIHIENTDTDLARACANFFEHKIAEILRAKQRCSLVLAGGKTPIKFYQELATRPLDWNKIDIFWSDERHVPPDHPDSNYLMVKKNLLSYIKIPAENIYRIKSELGNATAVATEYQHRLENYFFSLEIVRPHFDLVLLGMGEDGHTASLFSDSEITRQWTQAFWVDKLQVYRISLTPEILNRAANMVFLIEGTKKADILRQVFSANSENERIYPVELIRPSSGLINWFLDKKASSKIGDYLQVTRAENSE